MLKNIFLDDQEFQFNQTYLPILIHGKEGFGASLFTMTLLADFYSQGLKVIALTGFSMAREEFFSQTESFDSTQFFTKEKRDEFINVINNIKNRNEYVIFVKNIELFDEELFNAVNEFHSLIIAGDVTNCSFKGKLFLKPFTTKIYFSPLDTPFPPLQKYQGYLVFQTTTGIVSLQD